MATASVPAIVMVPVVVIGPPLVVRPVVPPLTLTLVTVPEPEGVAHVPSPRQKVVADALTPEFKLVTGKFPVTPVVSGSPVAFVKTAAEGVPSAGVVSVGDAERTTEPLPVDVVTPVPPFAMASVPPSVIVPDPVIGPPLVVRPVVPPLTLTLVTVPDPPAGVLQTNAVPLQPK